MNAREPIVNQREPTVNQREPMVNQREPTVNQREPTVNQYIHQHILDILHIQSHYVYLIVLIENQ
jgi:hypothetical protein